MQQYTLYYRDGCPYCVSALAALEAASIDVKIVSATADLKAELYLKSGIATFPQLFDGEQFLGDSVWIINNIGSL